MLADTTRRGHDDRPPDIEERYAVAATTSDLRIEGDETIKSAGDMIAAAGMNKHRTGITLLRLRSEWASSAWPEPPAPAAIEALAKSYKLETSGPHKGMVKTGSGDEARYTLPFVLARETAQGWYLHEQRLLVMSLKSLPWARDAILARSRDEGWGCDAHVVCAVLLWWLSPKCAKCGGRQDVVKLRGKEIGNVCDACKGTGQERQGDPPHGKRGAQVARHIRDCIADTKLELREGVYRLRRTDAGKRHRGES